MPSVRFSRIEGAKELVEDLRIIRTSVQKNVIGAMIGSAKILRRAIRKRLTTGDRHGRTYRLRPLRGSRRDKYTASAPGEPPASPTGNYPKAVTLKVEKGGEAVNVGILGSKGVLPLAETLERGNARIAARPHIEVEFRKREKAIIKRINKAFIRAVEKASNKLKR